MLVAKQKRKQNIAEYILYLYQVEDMIRAFQFDMDLIGENLVNKYKVDQNTRKDIADWYNNLLVMMDKEGLREAGHVQFLKNLVNDLNDFHLKLLETEKDLLYVQLFRATAGLLTELHQKNRTAQNDIQLALDTIYGYLLLKIKNTAISDETSEAVKRISQWLGSLAKIFRDFENGDFEF